MFFFQLIPLFPLRLSVIDKGNNWKSRKGTTQVVEDSTARLLSPTYNGPRLIPMRFLQLIYSNSAVFCWAGLFALFLSYSFFNPIFLFFSVKTCFRHPSLIRKCFFQLIPSTFFQIMQFFLHCGSKKCLEFCFKCGDLETSWFELSGVECVYSQFRTAHIGPPHTSSRAKSQQRIGVNSVSICGSFEMAKIVSPKNCQNTRTHTRKQLQWEASKKNKIRPFGKVCKCCLKFEPLLILIPDCQRVFSWTPTTPQLLSPPQPTPGWLLSLCLCSGMFLVCSKQWMFEVFWELGIRAQREKKLFCQ